MVDTLRLADGMLFPIPVTLDVSREDIDHLSLATGKRVTLRDPRDDQALAILTSKEMSASSVQSLSPDFPLVNDIYKPDLVKEAIKVLGADDPAHPSVVYLRTKVKEFYIGGSVSAIQIPSYFDHIPLRCKSRRCHSPVDVFR